MPQPPAAHQPNPSPDAPERQGVTGSVGDPNARPGSWIWAAVAIFIIGLIVLAIVRMTSTADERAPLPAEPTGGVPQR